MKKCLLILISIVVLSGCKPNDMNAAKQQYLCKDKGGVYEYGNIAFQLQCLDGSYIDWSNGKGVILPEGYRPNDIK